MIVVRISLIRDLINCIDQHSADDAGPNRASHQRYSIGRIKDDSCSAAACVREGVGTNILGPLQTLSEATMRSFHPEQREQARQAVYTSQKVTRARKQQTYISDVEMEAVGSRQGRSDTYYSG